MNLPVNMIALQGCQAGFAFGSRVKQRTRCNLQQKLMAGDPQSGRRLRISVKSSLDEGGEIFYPGTYGPWKIEQSDLVEVWTYRAAISAVASSFMAGVALADLAPPSALSEWGNALAVVGGAGLGVALIQIHIYVTPLKRMLQVFWALGTAGGTYLLLTHTDAPSLPAYVFENPSAVWLIGPAFAALTGLTFKEGVCYGKGEAFALTLAIPALLLLHLFVGNEGVDRGLSVVVAALLAVFAARKYTQPVKDDIGDGSVFKFMKLSPEEQEATLGALQRQEGR